MMISYVGRYTDVIYTVNRNGMPSEENPCEGGRKAIPIQIIYLAKNANVIIYNH